MDDLDEVASLLNRVLERLDDVESRLDLVSEALELIRNQVDDDLAAIRRAIGNLEPGVI
jgi:hypothetical protein